MEEQAAARTATTVEMYRQQAADAGRRADEAAARLAALQAQHSRELASALASSDVDAAKRVASAVRLLRAREFARFH
jgi:hypothetical protein